MKIIISGLIIFLFSMSAWGQDTFKISGKFIEESKEGIPAAEISLSAPTATGSDSTIASAFTEEDGTFLLTDIKPGNYKLILDATGFETTVREVSVTDKDTNLGDIIVGIKVEDIGNVIIQGQAIAVMQKGDTSEYNANAYKTNPDASAEDLVRKMPGMDLSGGTPKAQGEDITKVLVDGKPFFGEDASATLKNLPAEVVSSIQVYDEKNEQSQQSGFDDGQSTKTLNIVTREDKRQGIFGRVYGGYGLPDYYSAGFALNMFNKNQRITIVGQSNNINIQNFSSQDLGGSSSGGGRGGRGGGGNPSGGRRGGGGSNAGDFQVDQRSGITRTNAIGLNYSNVWKDKLKLSGSYFFNHSNNISEETIIRDNYVIPSLAGQKYVENNRSESNEYNHRFNLRLEYQIDSSNYIMFSPSIRIQNSIGNSVLNATTSRNETVPISTSSNIFNSKYNALNGDYRFLYSHKFGKEGRTISLANNTGFNTATGSNNLDASNTFVDTNANEDIDQIANLDNNGWNTYVNLNYTEPLGKKYRAQVNAGMRYQYSTSDKKTYDYNDISGSYDLLATALSNEFESRYTTQFAGLAFGFKDSLFNWNIGANAQKASLENERILPYESQLNFTFTNVLPYAALSYNLSKRKSIRFRYSTSTNTPSVTQLQDVLDNSNQLILRIGNPNLSQNFEHRIMANYRTSNSVQNSNFFVMAMAQITQDYVANATTIAEEPTVVNGIELQPGVQLIRPVNLDGYYRIFAFSNYGMPIKAIKSNLNLNASLGQIRTPGLINDELNYARNNTMNVGVSLSSNINENIDFTIGSQSNYSFVKNTINTNADNEFFNQNTRLDLNYIFAKRYFINTQLNHQWYTGLSSDFNQSFLLWNMAAGFKFLKNNLAEIKISVYDLLKQNQAISRTFTDIYTQDTRTNVLQQYFMLTFTYNLRYFKGNSSEKDMMEHNKMMNDREGGFRRGRIE